MENKALLQHKKTIKQVPMIQGTKIKLGPYPHNEEFYKIYQKWLERKDIQNDLGEPEQAPSLDEIKDMLTGWDTSEGNLSWCIFDIESGKPLGDINILTNQEFKVPEISIMVAESQNKGYGKEAMKLILDYAFNQIKIKKIALSVYKDNVRAVEFYKKLGFKTIQEFTKPEDEPEYLMEMENPNITKNQNP